MPTKIFAVIVRWAQKKVMQKGLRSFQPLSAAAGMEADSYDWQGLNTKYPFASF